MYAKKDPVKEIPQRIYRMNALANGIVLGVLFGAGVFIMTAWLLLKGGDVVGPHLALLGQFFIGYSVSWGGAFLGLLYGFIIGFFSGYLGSRIYNLMVRLKREST